MEKKDEFKQVILVNGWLDMPVGKVAAQVSHASMAFLTNWIREGGVSSESDGSTISKVDLTLSLYNSLLPEADLRDVMVNWLTGSFAKLILVVRSQEELDATLARIEKKGLLEKRDYFKIIDAGRTVFDGAPTYTCTGFKPMPQSQVNKLFGSLPLL